MSKHIIHPPSETSHDMSKAGKNGSSATLIRHKRLRNGSATILLDFGANQRSYLFIYFFFEDTKEPVTAILIGSTK